MPSSQDGATGGAWKTIRIDGESYEELKRWGEVIGLTVPKTIRVLVRQVKGAQLTISLPPDIPQEATNDR